MTTVPLYSKSYIWTINLYPSLFIIIKYLWAIIYNASHHPVRIFVTSSSNFFQFIKAKQVWSERLHLFWTSGIRELFQKGDELQCFNVEIPRRKRAVVENVLSPQVGCLFKEHRITPKSAHCFLMNDHCRNYRTKHRKKSTSMHFFFLGAAK